MFTDAAPDQVRRNVQYPTLMVQNLLCNQYAIKIPTVDATMGNILEGNNLLEGNNRAM